MELNNLAALNEFAASVVTVAAELKAEHEKSRYHMESKAALALKYNVSQRLFGGDSFFRECARKEICRRNRNAA